MQKRKMIKQWIVCSFILTALLAHSRAEAHFGMVIPSDAMVMQDDNRSVNLKLSFSHPFEGIGMELVKPKTFGVMFEGQKTDLLAKLTQTRIMKHSAWQLDYPIKRPGVHLFYMEPEPYFEPAEDCFIIHLTKTYVATFGDDEGWDTEIGLKTEIIPLAKPFGLYTGNVFQGIVKKNGKIVPLAEVEVEYYNEDGKAQAPTDFMVTQSIKADINGVFTYSAPRAGWWGFAALTQADNKMDYNGMAKDVELGAVIWVQFIDWKTISK